MIVWGTPLGTIWPPPLESQSAAECQAQYKVICASRYIWKINLNILGHVSSYSEFDSNRII